MIFFVCLSAYAYISAVQEKINNTDMTETSGGIFMNFRTDLALEAHKSCGHHVDGAEEKIFKKGCLTINRLTIRTKAAAEYIGKPMGTYITAQGLPLTNHFWEMREHIEILAEEINMLLPKKGTVMIAGIGNNCITPDALGPESAAAVIATRHIGGEIARLTGLDRMRPTAVISPGVLGQTGIETGEIMLSLVERIRPSAVIAIDALASRSISHLGKTIQISDTGISPGSGIGNRRFCLTEKTLGIPVIAVGIPTVVDALTLANDFSGGKNTTPLPKDSKNMIVTPKEIDLLISRASKLIGMTINCALQRDYDFDELCLLSES